MTRNDSPDEAAPDAQPFDLTRRKVLGGLSAVGLASVGAGLGTSAYFSDEETYTNNRLVAGSLDAKVDWEEHYSDWSDDEAQFGEMAPTFDAADYLLPAPATNPNALPILLQFDGESGMDDFWDATSIEAYPDGDDDGIQDAFDEEAVCTQDLLGDTPSALSSARRTSGTVKGQTTEPGDPLVHISDVKPGDFGEVTFSLHLCDNPGYVWMNGELRDEAENGLTEPERKDPQEGEGVELPDQLRTRFWYDPDCDNQVDRGDSPLEVMIVVDRSISISGPEMDDLKAGLDSFITALPGANSVRAGVLSFGNGSVTLEQDLADPASAAFTFDPVADLPDSGSGNTPLPPALDLADQVLDDQARSGAQQTIVLFTDGGPNYDNDTFSADGFAAPRSADFTLDPSDASYDEGGQSNPTGPGGISPGEMEETAHVAELIRDGGTRIVVVAVIDPSQGDPEVETRDYLRDEIASSQPDFKDVTFDNLAAVANSLVATVAVEKLFYEGTLREALDVLSTDLGLPLDGDRSTQFNEVGDDSTDPDRECFAGDATHCFGFEWWLPIDHGNQVQTDSVAFDLGFYTEQCRHNDGSGMAQPRCEIVSGSGWGKQSQFQDGVETSFARGRFGDNLASGAWEVALAEPTTPTPTIIDEGNYVWTSGATVPFTYSYDGSTAIFTLDGTTVSGAIPTPRDKVGIQLKADEASISVSNLELQNAGGETVESGQALGVSDEDTDGRGLQYLIYGGDCFDAASGFTLAGDVTVTLGDDYSGADEDVAFDVIVE